MKLEGKKVLNASCRNTTGSYLGHCTRKTDGCHYFKTLMVIFFPTSDEWVMPVSRQRTPRTEAVSGRPQGGLFILSLSVSQYVSDYRNIGAKSLHAGFNILTYENVKIYRSVCTMMYAQVQMLWSPWASWSYFVFSFAVCIAIYYATDLFSLFYILLLSSHNWVIYFYSTWKEKGFIQVWNNMRVSKW